jgi:hypothetical protein
MKVHTTVTQEVTLDVHAVEEVFNRRLERLCGGEGVYIDDKTGKLMSWEDTGHGSGITETLGDPTPVQKAAHALKDALREERQAALEAETKKQKGKKK